MSECNHNCSSCGNKCEHEIKMAVPTKDTKIKKIVAILSGKGGVGKSTVTSLLAIELARAGYKVGILDGDITGPSIPKLFGLNEQLFGDEEGVVPAVSSLGIKVVSINMMLQNEEDPVLWRGPILANVLNQFYSEVHWGDLDYLLIDMPPGTSDIAITLFQQIPLDEIIMVTTPSKLVSMVVGKAINMANQANKPIVAVIDNMAFVKCDKCGEEIKIYKNDDSSEVASKYGLKVLGKLPIDVELANAGDNGEIESYKGTYLKDVVEALWVKKVL